MAVNMEPEIIITRGIKGPEQILGLLQVVNYARVIFGCHSLELADKDNQQNISCIPEGTYKAVKYKSPTKGDVILLEEVPNRSYIEIHSGNFNSQILGCTLVGDSVTDINEDGLLDVTNSGNTLIKILALMPNTFNVTYR